MYLQRIIYTIPLQNKPFVDEVIRHLDKDSIAQYQAEERTMIAFRLVSSRYRVKDLLDIMHDDEISKPEKTKQLKEELSLHFKQPALLRSKTMGQLLKAQLKQTLRKSVLLIPKTKNRFDD